MVGPWCHWGQGMLRKKNQNQYFFQLWIMRVLAGDFLTLGWCSASRFYWNKAGGIKNHAKIKGSSLWRLEDSKGRSFQVSKLRCFEASKTSKLRSFQASKLRRFEALKALTIRSSVAPKLRNFESFKASKLKSFASPNLESFDPSTPRAFKPSNL